MKPPPVKPQQDKMLANLRKRFGDECVSEWRSFSGPKRHYSPRLDLAVGPFAVDQHQCGDRYDALAQKHHAFLKQLWNLHEENAARIRVNQDQTLDSALRVNPNARCFLAIEIENKVSRKHLMGGALNAEALGRLGVLVGWTEEKVRAMFRTVEYLAFLGRVRKPTMKLGNLIILGREQALEAFGRYGPLSHETLNPTSTRTHRTS